ncbi:TIGR01620 family protein [Rheinheimera sp. MMS21-TC3]|uniref:TIGR01620 family protein n=1 Tax=Rheinheimera sp. MMS21-TC3 TaxID=3072790 RepID=UPI0028C37FB1|nr:TIGR01620 family protein [Rheinheimera sp. MMS21-TC3]WNO61442.1 TIGR01620 family protein [Rheinheimera sp. MMS21-TC3]
MNELKSAQYFDSTVLTPNSADATSSASKTTEFKAIQHYTEDNFVVTEEESVATVLKSPHKWWWRLAKASLLLVVIAALWQWVDMLQQAWQHNMTKAVFLTLTSMVLLVLFTTLLWREVLLWRRLARNKQWQDDAKRINANVQFGEANALCQAVVKSLPNSAVIINATELWQQARRDEHSDNEQLALFEQIVLAELDKQAQQRIYRAATDTSFAVAISPFALADMIMVLWRSSRLLRELAQLYGGAIGQLRSLVLLKQLFAALLWAGGSEIALDMAADVLSSELTAKLSLRAGQGLIAGLLVARIGNLAQQQLRPLPSTMASKVSIAKLASSLTSRLKTKTADTTV